MDEVVYYYSVHDAASYHDYFWGCEEGYVQAELSEVVTD